MELSISMNQINLTSLPSKKVASDSHPVTASRHLLKKIRRHLFSISPAEVSTAKRGFQVDDPAKQERIESIGRFFLMGYHAAINAPSTEQLQQSLNDVSLEYQGFAYEGAAMGLGLIDHFSLWGTSQFTAFLTQKSNHYPYLTHVGFGWSLARIPRGIRRFSQRFVKEQTVVTDASSLDSLLACLVIDGYGFHQGYFAWEQYVQQRKEPSYLPPACLPLFNQGLGRSLCFVLGMDWKRIVNTINQFPRSRQAYLWSGVGLAATYAGGLRESEIEFLKNQSHHYLPAFAQGVAFAAKARHRGNYVPEHTALVCQQVWGSSVETIAALTDTTLQDLPLISKLDAYCIWQQRLQQAYIFLLA